MITEKRLEQKRLYLEDREHTFNKAVADAEACGYVGSDGKWRHAVTQVFDIKGKRIRDEDRLRRQHDPS